MKRFEENLEAIKRLWTEDEVDMVGSHFTLRAASPGMPQSLALEQLQLLAEEVLPKVGQG